MDGKSSFSTMERSKQLNIWLEQLVLCVCSTEMKK